jgi:hypothetical protein
MPVVLRNGSSWSSNMPKENDLEGPQDQGGKHGGQQGMPKAADKPRQGTRTKGSLIPANA